MQSMEEFLSVNSHETLAFHLKRNNVTNDNFFTMDVDQLFSLLNDYEKVDDFKECYLIEKQSLNVAVSTNNMIVPLYDLTNVQNNNIVANQANGQAVNYDKSVDIQDNSNGVHESVHNKISPDNLSDLFEQNDLFHLLNSSLLGRVILGRYYNNPKSLDLQQVCNLYLLSKFNENSMQLKLGKDDFICMKSQLRQLFPHLDEDYLFVHEDTDENSHDSVSSPGYLYIRYNAVRKLLREAGFASEVDISRDFVNKKVKLVKETQFDCLHYNDPNKYDYNDIVLQWGNTFSSRLQTLEPVKNSDFEKVTLQKYFDSFPCICSPVQKLELLAYDYKSLIDLWHKSKKLPNDPTHYWDIFNRNWPLAVRDLIKLVKTSVKRNVKQFYADNKELFDCDKLSEVATLKALVFFLKTTKSGSEYKDLQKKASTPKSRRTKANENSTLLTTEQSPQNSPKTKKRKIDLTDVYQDEIIEKSFVFRISSSSNLQEEQNAFENFLIEEQIELHPYIILHGNPEGNHQVYVVLNRERYLCSTLSIALDKCFKCIVSLRHVPYLCDIIRLFFMKRIYELKLPKPCGAVGKLCTDLNALYAPVLPVTVLSK